jgi:hypothetical protein
VERKIFVRVIKERLEKELQGKISEIRNGFTQGRVCVDSVLVLKGRRENASGKKKVLLLASVYLRTAYDSVLQTV